LVTHIQPLTLITKENRRRNSPVSYTLTEKNNHNNKYNKRSKLKRVDMVGTDG
jgi:hypothetical protein